MVQLAAVIIVIIGVIILWPFILGAVLILLGLLMMFWKVIVGVIVLVFVVGVAGAMLPLLIGNGNSRPINKSDDGAADLEWENHLANQRAIAIAEQERISKDFAERPLQKHYEAVPEHLNRLPRKGKHDLDNYIYDVLSPLLEKWKASASEEFGYQDSCQGEFLKVFLEALPTHDVSRMEMHQLEWASSKVRHHYDQRRGVSS